MSKITRIANVIIPTEDQDRAVNFYTGVLGLEKRVDIPFGEGGRWIEVAPPQADTVIAICPPGPGVSPGGKETGIAFSVDDIDSFHAQVTAAGVDVDDEVLRYGDIPMFWLRDPEANNLQVVESR